MEQLKEGPVATMNSTIRQESVGELLNISFDIQMGIQT